MLIVYPSDIDVAGETSALGSELSFGWGLCVVCSQETKDECLHIFALLSILELYTL